MYFDKCVFGILFTIAALTFNVIANRPQRLIKGSYAKPNEFPYMVSLRYVNNLHFCGGVVISTSHILTAAHCIDSKNMTPIIAVVGTNNLSYGGSKHSIKKIKWHPRYTENDPFALNDIAVLTLTKPLSYFDPYWATIKLASQDYGPGFPATAAGFGNTDVNAIAPNSESLLKIEADLVHSSKCLFNDKRTNENHLCTLSDKGQGVCDGDSGGPLIIGGEVVGIASYTGICGSSPSVYTKVYKYRDFIKRESGVEPEYRRSNIKT